MPTKPKAEICMLHNETVDLLPLAAENFYRRLVDAVDDEGRCVSGPEHLFSICYPLRSAISEAERKKLIDSVRHCLATLIDVGLASEYLVGNVRYLRVNTLRFGKPRTPSKLPAEIGAIQLDLEGPVAFGNCENGQNQGVNSDVSPHTPLLNPVLTLGDLFKNPPLSDPLNAIHFFEDEKSLQENLLVYRLEHEHFFRMIGDRHLVSSYRLLAQWWNRYCSAHKDDGSKFAKSGASVGSVTMAGWKSISAEEWFVRLAPAIIHLAFGSDLLTRRAVPSTNRTSRWILCLPWIIRRKDVCKGLLEGRYRWTNGMAVMLDTDMVIEYIMSESPRKLFRAMTHPEASQVAVSFVDYWERDGGKNRHDDWKKTIDAIRDQRIIDVVKGGGR